MIDAANIVERVHAAILLTSSAVWHLPAFPLMSTDASIASRSAADIAQRDQEPFQPVHGETQARPEPSLNPAQSSMRWRPPPTASARDIGDRVDKCSRLQCARARGNP